MGTGRGFALLAKAIELALELAILCIERRDAVDVDRYAAFGKVPPVRVSVLDDRAEIEKLAYGERKVGCRRRGTNRCRDPPRRRGPKRRFGTGRREQRGARTQQHARGG
eukprot:Amastigsp_a342259_22.p2 type:complete len:109 gc:universal Amastigsp_a342259_22:355-29(-)